MLPINGYSNLREIRDGPTGTICQAIRDEDQRPVFIKILAKSFPSQRELASYQQEFDLTHALDIEGVIKPYALESVKNSCALVFEHFEGTSLATLMSKGRLSMELFLRAATQMAYTLGRIHQENIIHRDIKPDNIFINPRTYEIKITEFGIATQLPRERQQVTNSDKLEGTLAYMSPEQTGRMNRTMDYRSDMYSLGVTLYEMITGRLPFDTQSPAELVHAHIAIQPVNPRSIRPDLPGVVSDIIMKCMEKNAEDRYQSAFGVKADLESCLKMYKEQGEVRNFIIGERDVADRFQIPEKLYGRQDEIDRLLMSFQNAREGMAKILFVSGFSGVGKSSLVHEVHKPIARHAGYFAEGKFEQYKRDVPYYAIIQGFQDIIRQLLTESEERIGEWKKLILDACGPNGQVILDVIPEMEHIIGPQAPASVLSPEQAQNRFNLVFTEFLRVFTKRENPLVLFLDDLQWADNASLQLIELLMNDHRENALFLIGAYRDNEVPPTHALSIMLESFDKAGIEYDALAVAPLDLFHLRQLVADALHRDTEDIGPLAQLVHEKTNGNPFFVSQFLKSLHQEAMIFFNPATNQWEWDMQRIEASNITDNVADLMLRNINRLPENTQKALQFAAAIGNQFDLKLLSLIHGRSLGGTSNDLWSALQEGLILPMGDHYKYLSVKNEDLAATQPVHELSVSYKFLHDRVQQAAYSMLEEHVREHVHLEIGRLILKSTSDEEIEDHLFDIVNHLNTGSAHLENERERIRLAEMNLRASNKAKASTAYDTALRYANHGLELLPTRMWESKYDQAFALYMNKAECEYLTALPEHAEKSFQVALANARTRAEKAQVHIVRGQLYRLINRFEDAFHSSLEGLRLYGIDLSPGPLRLRLVRRLLKVRWLLRKRDPNYFMRLSEMTDEESLMIMQLLMHVIPSSYFVDRNVMLNAVLLIIELTLKKGISDVTAFALVSYAHIVGSYFGNYRAGEEYGRAALALNERITSPEVKSKVYCIYGFLVKHWRTPIRECIDILKEGLRVGYEIGDLTYAGYSFNRYTDAMFQSGVNMDVVVEEINKYLDIIYHNKDEYSINYNLIRNQAIRNLQGLTDERMTFNDERFDQEEYIHNLEEIDVEMNITFFHIYNLRLKFLFGAYAEAIAEARMAEVRLETITGMWDIPEFYFYKGLTLAATYSSVSKKEQREASRQINRSLKKLKRWADNSPYNYELMFQALKAEIERVRGHDAKAMKYYEDALATAERYELVQYQAVINELAARFYLDKGIQSVGRTYLVNAENCYERWGAMAKVDHLREKYAECFPRDSSDDSASSAQPLERSATLDGPDISPGDLADILRASQSISGESVLGDLLKKIMENAMQSAGAERGFILFQHDNQLFIEAEAVPDYKEVRVLQSIPLEAGVLVSQAIAHYVARTRQRVILDNAEDDPLFAKDAYVANQKPRSVLCVPMIFQGTLQGMIYLENNLAKGAFTRDRVELINMLASQAAIAVGQARVNIDTLTHAWVRDHFMERALLALSMSNHGAESCYLLMIDLDHFKEKNDTYGHLVGDIVLKDVARRLKGALREDDLLGRFGGEEFIVLLQRSTHEHAMAVAERLLDIVSNRPIETHGHQIVQSVSIGLAAFIDAGESLEQLMGRADKALYEAKRGGRNRVVAAS